MNSKDALKNNSWLHFYQMQSIDENKYISPIITSGKGVYLYDSNGKEFLDSISGAYCVNVGYGRDSIIDKAANAAKKVHYVSPFSFANLPAVELTEKLSKLAEPVVGAESRIFFVNSGSEAVETAAKIARAYSRRTTKPNGYKIICRDKAYHGTTFGAMSFCGFPDLKKEYGPGLPGVYHAPNTICSKCPLKLDPATCRIACANSFLDIIDAQKPDEVSAVLIEPFETSSGMVPPPQGYLEKVYEICKQSNTLLILDEVITGFGRLTKWFGAEHYNIKADIIVCAKALTSGYDSLAAVIVSKEVADVFLGDDDKMFQHGATFGGRPGAAAAALENIRIIEEENLLENASQMSLYLNKLIKNKLTDLKIVGEVRGDGLLFGIDLVKHNKEPLSDIYAINNIRNSLINKGLITSLYYTRNEPIIELAPPLNISSNECEQIVDILYSTLK